MNWLFMDMNSYFASVEQHLRPELRGRQVGVIPVESETSCVIAASAAAKRCGVKTGTRVGEARRLCPGIVLVRARPRIYVEVHKSILHSVEQCAPIHKIYSIDEWAIRLMGRERQVDQAVKLARQIKSKLLENFSPSLTCSIGIAPTRLLAKIACELQKPDGLVALDVADLPARLDELKLEDLPGIAEGILRRLNAGGIHAIADLWAVSRADARRLWGSVQGEAWWCGFHGHDEPEPVTHRHSMGHSHVLPPEFRNDTAAHGILARLLCKAAARLRYHGYFARRLQVFVDRIDAPPWDAQAPLQGVQDTLTILREFESLWTRRPWAAQPRSARRSILKVGVTLGELTAAAFTPDHLFPEQERLRQLSLAVDKIDQRWGRNTIYFGSLHDYRHEMDDKIAFGRIPDESI